MMSKWLVARAQATGADSPTPSGRYLRRSGRPFRERLQHIAVYGGCNTGPGQMVCFMRWAFTAACRRMKPAWWTRPPTESQRRVLRRSRTTGSWLAFCSRRHHHGTAQQPNPHVRGCACVQPQQLMVSCGRSDQTGSSAAEACTLHHQAPAGWLSYCLAMTQLVTVQKCVDLLLGSHSAKLSESLLHARPSPDDARHIVLIFTSEPRMYTA